MTTALKPITLDRFIGLRDKYNRIVPLAERKAVEIGREFFGYLDDDNVDLLIKQYEVYGSEKQNTLQDLLLEYDLRRRDIECGRTTGDAAQDIAFAQYGLHPQYSSILERTRLFFDLIGKSQYLLMLNYWEIPQGEDAFPVDRNLCCYLGRLRRPAISILPNPSTRSYWIRDEIDPDEHRPSLVLVFNTHAMYAEGRSLKPERNLIWGPQRCEINMDPRVLPYLRFENDEIVASIPVEVIPRYDFGMENAPSSLIKVEVIRDEDKICRAMFEYVGISSPLHLLS